ncbi:MAG: hypothetical protein ACR2G3_03265 [Solirubrobacterales bacterium]
MEFILVSSGMVAVVVFVLVLLGRAYPGSGADLVDWKPTRSYEDEAQLELDDVAQMMKAQNEMRRRRGRTEMTPEDLDRMVAEDEAVRARAHPALTEEEPDLAGPGSDPDAPRGSGPPLTSGPDPT